jgi:hypothetical protein
MLITLVMVGRTPSAAQNYFKTGGDLVRECDAVDQFLRGTCAGYIVGALDAYESERFARRQLSCLPSAAVVEELVSKFVGAIRSDPGLSGEIPASIALSNVYRGLCLRPSEK